MRRGAAILIWDALWWAAALIPLGIVWASRTVAPSLSALLIASAAYLAAVVLTLARGRSNWRRSQVRRAFACVASVAAAVLFESVGRAVLSAGRLDSVGFEIATAIIVYVSAVNAAWLLVWTVALAIRGRRPR